MNIRETTSVHCIGIGGINMSAVAKLLLSRGVRVSGSDAARNEQTDLLVVRGASIQIGHDVKNIPPVVDVVIYSSAVPATNPEREEAQRRGIPQMTNFQFLGDWFAQDRTVLVCGTHGKSTTTAMLGQILVRAKLDPTVIVGSKLPSFSDGNLHIGATDLCVIEGDEYARHFLEFHPFGVVLNNIELDHTDVFPTLTDLISAFRELLKKINDGGILVANIGDVNVSQLVAEEARALGARGVRIVPFGHAVEARAWSVTSEWKDGYNRVSIEQPSVAYRLILKVPGSFNALNAGGAALMARELGASYQDIGGALEAFTGIWRRLELLREENAVRWYSDYGHHPTAVASTVRALKEAFPSSRVVLCFQPHHRNRTKHLFLEFVTSFDEADALVLCEIYDVAGRDASEDADVSSDDLRDAIVRHDADRGVARHVEYAHDPKIAVERTRALAEKGDIIVFMGAGNIDDVARETLK